MAIKVERTFWVQALDGNGRHISEADARLLVARLITALNAKPHWFKWVDEEAE